MLEPRKRTSLVRRVGAMLALVGLATTSSEKISAAEDLSGTYLFFQEARSVTPVPVLKDVVAYTRSTMVYRVRHVDGRLKGSGDLCDMHVETSSSLVKTHFSRAFLRSLPRLPLNAKLTGDGTHMTVSQTFPEMVVGARLKNSGDRLPRRASDPRVFDQDGDGKPGMTVRISGLFGGDVYVAQRNVTRFRGKRSGRSFSGQLFVKTEQAVLGATSIFLRTAPKPRADDARSRFRLVKVPSGTTCKRAVQLMKKHYRQP